MKLASTGTIYGSVCFIITAFIGYVVGAWIGLLIGIALGCVLFGISMYAYGMKDDAITDGWTVEEGRGGPFEKDRGQLPRGFYSRDHK